MRPSPRPPGTSPVGSPMAQPIGTPSATGVFRAPSPSDPAVSQFSSLLISTAVRLMLGHMKARTRFPALLIASAAAFLWAALAPAASRILPLAGGEPLGPLDPVPDDRLLEPSYRFQRPSMGHVELASPICMLSRKRPTTGTGSGPIATRSDWPRFLDASRPLNVIDPKFPPLYRNTAWRVTGYGRAHRADQEQNLSRADTGRRRLPAARNSSPMAAFSTGGGARTAGRTRRTSSSAPRAPGLSLLDAYRITGDKKVSPSGTKSGRMADQGRRLPQQQLQFLRCLELKRSVPGDQRPRLPRERGRENGQGRLLRAAPERRLVRA